MYARFPQSPGTKISTSCGGTQPCFVFLLGFGHCSSCTLRFMLCSIDCVSAQVFVCLQQAVCALFGFLGEERKFCLLSVLWSRSAASCPWGAVEKLLYCLAHICLLHKTRSSQLWPPILTCKSNWFPRASLDLLRHPFVLNSLAEVLSTSPRAILHRWQCELIPPSNGRLTVWKTFNFLHTFRCAFICELVFVLNLGRIIDLSRNRRNEILVNEGGAGILAWGSLVCCATWQNHVQT